VDVLSGLAKDGPWHFRGRVNGDALTSLREPSDRVTERAALAKGLGFWCALAMRRARLLDLAIDFLHHDHGVPQCLFVQKLYSHFQSYVLTLPRDCGFIDQ
jgi:hypothetical protein